MTRTIAFVLSVFGMLSIAGNASAIKPRMGRIRPSLAIVPEDQRTVVRRMPRIRPSIRVGEQEAIKVRRAPRTPGRYGALASGAGGDAGTASKIRLALELSDRSGLVESYSAADSKRYAAEAKKAGYPQISIQSESGRFKNAIAYKPPEWQVDPQTDAYLVVDGKKAHAVAVPR